MRLPVPSGGIAAFLLPIRPTALPILFAPLCLAVVCLSCLTFTYKLLGLISCLLVRSVLPAFLLPSPLPSCNGMRGHRRLLTRRPRPLQRNLLRSLLFSLPISFQAAHAFPRLALDLLMSGTDRQLWRSNMALLYLLPFLIYMHLWEDASVELPS